MWAGGGVRTGLTGGEVWGRGANGHTSPDRRRGVGEAGCERGGARSPARRSRGKVDMGVKWRWGESRGRQTSGSALRLFPSIRLVFEPPSKIILVAICSVVCV